MPNYPSADEAVASFTPAELAEAIEQARQNPYQARREVVTVNAEVLTPKQSAAFAALAATFGPDAQVGTKYGSTWSVTLPKTYEELKDTVVNHRMSLIYSQRVEAEKEPDSIIE